MEKKLVSKRRMVKSKGNNPMIDRRRKRTRGNGYR